ncbi:MAG: NUDIX domain-containing protein, partial [Candidatus Aenigmatarchaeota archaeon]
DSKFLAEKRKEDNEIDPGALVFPGGHVKEGESLFGACRREFREEFGLDCGTFEFICTLPYTASNNEQMDLHYFFCKGWSGEPKSLEAEKLVWLGPEELENLSFDEDKQAVAEFILAKGEIF